MNIYYELSDRVANNATVSGRKGKYFVLHSQSKEAKIPSLHFELARHSERVWQEDHNQIKFIKHRYINILEDIPVDEKEFMWVKLKAKTLA